MADATLELTLEPEVASFLTIDAQGVFEPRSDIIGNYLREIYSADDLEPIDEVGTRRQLQQFRIALKEIDLGRQRGTLIPTELAVKVNKDDLVALIAAVNQLRFFWHNMESDLPDKIEAAINKIRHRYADRCEQKAAREF